MTTYKQFHARSISDPQGFWAEQAALVDWKQPFKQVLDYSRPPFAKWFVGGTTNLCHNAVDRHLAARGDQAALIYISTETGEEKTYTFAQLYREVNRMAGILKGLGVGRGDRVLIYMPMIRGSRRSRCWPARASARSTRSCSAASRRSASPPGSTTRSRR